MRYSIKRFCKYWSYWRDRNKHGFWSYLIADLSFPGLFFLFFTMYIILGGFFGFFYYVLPGQQFCLNDKPIDIELLPSLYFSFITQLTIGYGDYSPVGLTQLLAIVQGILGVFIIGIWAGLFLAKWMVVEDKESILLSNWAGYSLEEERFFILYVNRNISPLLDANLIGGVRLKNYEPNPPNVKPTYIGNSAWTFALREVSIAKLSKMDFKEGDGIKICISGTAGITRCTSWKKYDLAQIYVFPNREYFWQDEFRDPKFDYNFYLNFERPLAEEIVPFLEFDFDSEAKKRRSDNVN